MSDVLDIPTSNFRLSETSVGTAIVGHYIKEYFPDNYSGSFYGPLVVGGGACDKLQLAESQKQESYLADNFKTVSAYNEMNMSIARHMLEHDWFKVLIAVSIDENNVLKHQYIVNMRTLAVAKDGASDAVLHDKNVNTY